jgi:hypothetical protein
MSGAVAMGLLACLRGAHPGLRAPCTNTTLHPPHPITTHTHRTGTHLLCLCLGLLARPLVPPRGGGRLCCLCLCCFLGLRLCLLNRLLCHLSHLAGSLLWIKLLQGSQGGLQAVHYAVQYSKQGGQLRR